MITGAQRGLGRELALQFSERGIAVVVTALQLELAQEVVDEIKGLGGTAWAVQLDVTNDASVNRAVTEVQSFADRLEILVNNAGIFIDDLGGPLEANLAIVQQTLETNFFGAWRVCKAFVPLMRGSKPGKIINISSSMGQLETMGMDSPAYRVSKACLNALTAMLAVQLRESEILVNAVDPGSMRTEIGGPDAPLSVKEGAQSLMWLASLPKGSESGGFYSGRRLIPW